MGILETAKEAAKLVQQLDNIDLVKVILNLQRECYDLVFENRELREKLIKAEEALVTKDALTYRNDCYWFGDGSQEEHGPICATCWDADHLVVRMHRKYNGWVECQKCKKTAHVPGDRFARRSERVGPVNW